MVRLMLVVAACSSSTAPGSATPARDARVADGGNDGGNDARNDARVVDAAVANVDSTKLPDPPILLAISVWLSSITIAKLDKTGLHVVHTDDVGNTSFGWADAHTLVTLATHDDSAVVTRFVDGERAEAITISKHDWDDPSSSQLLVTKTHEVWLTACTKRDADGNACKRSRYLRVLPTRGNKATSKRPAGADNRRTADAYVNRERWPVPPTTTIANIRLELVTIKAAGRDRKGVTCHSAGGDATYPGDDWDPSSNFVARTARWVVAVPPIYEVAADVTNPVDYTERQYFYFRACEDAPLDNFAWLGDGIWAAYAQPAAANTADKNGVWTIYVADTPVGTLLGLDALRANR